MLCHSRRADLTRIATLSSSPSASVPSPSLFYRFSPVPGSVPPRFVKCITQIRRGKSRRPVEFGHVVLLSETKEKFISDYEVMEYRIPDPQLAALSVENHERIFGEAPEVLDRRQRIQPGSPRPRGAGGEGRDAGDPPEALRLGEVIGSVWQRFRAGIEGSISVLKRAFRLLRCPYRGFKSFAASVGHEHLLPQPRAVGPSAWKVRPGRARKHDVKRGERRESVPNRLKSPPQGASRASSPSWTIT